MANQDRSQPDDALSIHRRDARRFKARFDAVRALCDEADRQQAVDHPSLRVVFVKDIRAALSLHEPRRSIVQRWHRGLRNGVTARDETTAPDDASEAPGEGAVDAAARALYNIQCCGTMPFDEQHDDDIATWLREARAALEAAAPHLRRDCGERQPRLRGVRTRVSLWWFRQVHSGRGHGCADPREESW